MQFMYSNPEFKREIVKLKTFALANPVDLTNGIPKNYVLVGDNPKYVLNNGTFRIVYSVEKQPVGMCHHVSVSAYGKKPAIWIVDFILKELGMLSLQDDLFKEKCTVFFENESNAVNIVQTF